jgi:hypothetical protein
MCLVTFFCFRVYWRESNFCSTCHRTLHSLGQVTSENSTFADENLSRLNRSFPENTKDRKFDFAIRRYMAYAKIRNNLFPIKTRQIEFKQSEIFIRNRGSVRQDYPLEFCLLYFFFYTNNTFLRFEVLTTVITKLCLLGYIAIRGLHGFISQKIELFNFLFLWKYWCC